MRGGQIVESVAPAVGPWYAVVDGRRADHPAQPTDATIATQDGPSHGIRDAAGRHDRVAM
jgi:hypothetical protein